jgi:hypothetical protein
MAKTARAKLSTTVAPENYRFLTALVKNGKAGSLAEAVDEVVEQFRRIENRRRLATATSAYFESLTPEELADDQSLGESMSKAAAGMNFDREP